MRGFFNSKLAKFSQNLAMSGMVLLLSNTSAYALPGQNLQTIRQWAKKSFVLPPELIYNPDYDAYTGIRTIDGGMLALYVKVRPQDGVSVQEQIVTQIYEPNLTFARNNAAGLGLIERIYTPEIAKDFQTARYVAQIGSTDFYQGQEFAYVTLQQGGIRRFSVIPRSDLNQAIKQEVSCQNSNCVIYQPFKPTTGSR